MDSKMNFFLQEDENPESLWITSKGENKKKRLSVDQVQLLEKNFNVLNKLEHDKKLHLAKEIGLQPRQVAVWFQNRRARSKNKKVENDYDSLNSEYDKLQKDYDNLLLENQRLKAEVDELRCKRIANEKMKKNPLEPVEAVNSSVTEFGKSNTRCFTMGSCRQEEGSRSSSKSVNFYSESPAMENQSQAADFFQVEQEANLGSFGKLEDGNYVEELMDSYNIITAIEDQPFFFWS